jgi:hypothetical protein
VAEGVRATSDGRRRAGVRCAPRGPKVEGAPRRVGFDPYGVGVATSDAPDDSHAREPEALTERVRRWLTTTGYPLEMRVALELSKQRPSSIEQSKYYVDLNTRKIRETDVVGVWTARHENLDVELRLVVECKSKPAPWIVFDSGDGPSEAIRERWDLSLHRAPRDAVGNEIPFAPNPKSFEMHRSLFKPGILSYGVVELTTKANRDRREAVDGNGVREQSGDRDVAWDAVHKAVSAAEGLLAELPDGETRFNSAPTAHLVVPVVVTTGGLVRAYLAGSEIEVEEVERAEVLVRLAASSAPKRCLVVREEGLPKLLDEVQSTLDVLATSGQTG